MQTENILFNDSIMLALAPDIAAKDFNEDRIKFDATHIVICDIEGFRIEEIMNGYHILHCISSTNPAKLFISQTMLDEFTDKYNKGKWKQEKIIIVEKNLSSNDLKTLLSYNISACTLSRQDAIKFDMRANPIHKPI